MVPPPSTYGPSDIVTNDNTRMPPMFAPPVIGYDSQGNPIHGPLNLGEHVPGVTYDQSMEQQPGDVDVRAMLKALMGQGL
jgi:hypothetical protein